MCYLTAFHTCLLGRLKSRDSLSCSWSNADLLLQPNCAASPDLCVTNRSAWWASLSSPSDPSESWILLKFLTKLCIPLAGRAILLENLQILPNRTRELGHAWGSQTDTRLCSIPHYPAWVPRINNELASMERN